MNAPVASPVSALCECGSGLRAIRCCSMQLGSLSPPEAIRHLVPLVERAIQAHRQGADETAERLCLDVLELAPDRPGALSVLYEIRKAQGKAPRRRGADPPHRRARSQQSGRHQRARLDPARQGQPGGSRAPRPQRRAHRAGEPAGAQPDGHDPDRGQPAPGRRIPLPPRAGAGRPARSDPARQSRLEPEEPGPHGGGPRALRGDPPTPRRKSARPCWASRGWRKRTATSMPPPACSTGWTSCSPTTRACG